MIHSIRNFSTALLFATLFALVGPILPNAAHADELFVPSTSPQFKKYWYAGEAEISRYDLKQVRYGEVHEGDAVMIFVTENFLADEQVKDEGWPSEGKSESILKLNLTKKFITGIYPYSVMTSVFTPVDKRKTPSWKVTASTQEWCGQTYMQLNFRDNGFEGLHHSYFQKEGDSTFRLESALLEDEIWTLIRLGASDLPTGEIEIVPALTHLRMAHQTASIENATATLGEVEGLSESGSPLKAYEVAYAGSGRKIRIVFESNFPFSIERWSETHPGRRGDEPLVTEAVRTHTIKLDYWNRNGSEDIGLRDGLGLR